MARGGAERIVRSPPRDPSRLTADAMTSRPEVPIKSRSSRSKAIEVDPWSYRVEKGVQLGGGGDVDFTSNAEHDNVPAKPGGDLKVIRRVVFGFTGARGRSGRTRGRPRPGACG